MRFSTAPNAVQPGSCDFQPDHIGAWVETAQLETAPTKWENGRCGFQPWSRFIGPHRASLGDYPINKLIFIQIVVQKTIFIKASVGRFSKIDIWLSRYESRPTIDSTCVTNRGARFPNLSFYSSCCSLCPLCFCGAYPFYVAILGGNTDAKR